MAKVKVTYKCGHEGYISVFGKSADRERKIAWIEQNQECPECAARRNAEINRVAAEKAAAAELPALTGSEKQIAWATTLRNKALDTIEGLMKNVSEEMIPVVKRTIALWLADKTAASYWIDYRTWLSEGRLVCEMMDPYLPKAKAEITAETAEAEAETVEAETAEAEAETVEAETAEEVKSKAITYATTGIYDKRFKAEFTEILNGINVAAIWQLSNTEKFGVQFNDALNRFFMWLKHDTGARRYLIALSDAQIAKVICFGAEAYNMGKNNKTFDEMSVKELNDIERMTINYILNFGQDMLAKAQLTAPKGPKPTAPNPESTSADVETAEEQPSTSISEADAMRDAAADAVVEWIKTGENRHTARNRVNGYMEFSGANTSPDGLKGAIARRRIVAQEVLLRCITPLSKEELKKAEEELYVIAGEISPANNGKNLHAMREKIREMTHCRMYSIDLNTVFDALWAIVDLNKIKPAYIAEIVDFGCYQYNYAYNQAYIEDGTRHEPRYTGILDPKKPDKGYEPDTEAIGEYSDIYRYHRTFEAILTKLAEFIDLRKFTPKQTAEIMDFGYKMNICGREAAYSEILRIQ